MLRSVLMAKSAAGAVIVVLAGLNAGVHADDRRPLAARTGHVVFEVIGQVNNAPTPAPLGSSTQFGYVSFAEGIDQVFTSDDPASQNQTTAMLTFFTDVVTTRVTANGPLTIIIREGTTTFYRNTAPADFAVPATFKSGDPVATSTIRQQVILDTVEKTFTVTNVNTVTESTAFEIGGGTVRLARVNDVLRTSLVGVLKARDGVPPPTGFFSGYAVAADRNNAEPQ